LDEQSGPLGSVKDFFLGYASQVAKDVGVGRSIKAAYEDVLASPDMMDTIAASEAAGKRPRLFQVLLPSEKRQWDYNQWSVLKGNTAALGRQDYDWEKPINDIDRQLEHYQVDKPAQSKIDIDAAMVAKETSLGLLIAAATALTGGKALAWIQQQRNIERQTAGLKSSISSAADREVAALQEASNAKRTAETTIPGPKRSSGDISPTNPDKVTPSEIGIGEESREKEIADQESRNVEASKYTAPTGSKTNESIPPTNPEYAALLKQNQSLLEALEKALGTGAASQVGRVVVQSITSPQKNDTQKAQYGGGSGHKQTKQTKKIQVPKRKAKQIPLSRREKRARRAALQGSATQEPSPKRGK
jgi:hypothetical protein